MQLINFNQHIGGIGKLQGLPQSRAIITVVKFIQDTLVLFSGQFKDSAVKNENGLTQELCTELNYTARVNNYPFWFSKEEMEDTSKGNSPSTDMAVKTLSSLKIDAKLYAGRDVFFSMEAKRLGNLGKAREKEYLIGRQECEKYVESGGVERFKKKLHGRNVTQGAIIGYIQTDDFDTWHSKINQWVTELIEERGSQVPPWTEGDKLSLVDSCDEVAAYESENSRATDYIRLFHLWVNLV